MRLGSQHPSYRYPFDVCRQWNCFLGAHIEKSMLEECKEQLWTILPVQILEPVANIMSITPNIVIEIMFIFLHLKKKYM